MRQTFRLRGSVKSRHKKQTLSESLGLNAFRLFKNRQMALFFVFSMLLGMSLQITNGFAGPFLTSSRFFVL